MRSSETQHSDKLSGAASTESRTQEEFSCFTLEIREHVAHLRLDRPKHFNAMTRALFEELPRAVRALDASGEVRAIVLSSTGRHFSMGMDLSLLASLGDGGDASERRRLGVRARVRALQDTINVLEDARMPVIAAIQGGCIGGALDMAAACDIRHASADAFFCIQEIHAGLAADLGSLQRLPHLIPQGVLRELAYTGRRLSAARALEIGLVSAVYPGIDELHAGALGLAGEIAERSPAAVWGSKQQIRYARDHPVADALEYVATWQAGAFQPAEVGEALAARRSRRKPRFDDLPPLD